MAMATIKTAEEMARLDAIFAEIEAEERGETVVAAQPPRTTAEERLMSQSAKQIVANAKGMLKDGSFKTKWEKVLAKTLIQVVEDCSIVEKKQISLLNTELNTLRNFVTAVDTRLQKAEKAAKEQDNHHYYKIFAEGVKTLLDSI